MKSIFALCLALSLQSAIAVEPLSYNRDIRPILSDNCFACHGPDKANQKAGLRLDVRDVAIKPVKSGDTAIVPGNLDKSTLIARILTSDEDEIMPPPKSHKQLATAQKEILKRWVAEGAAYEKHWAFQSVQPVKVPTAAGLPKADAELLKWPRNPIDWFVLQKLTERGLKPSLRAEASTLARRMALDLTGLPPRAELIKGFDAAKPDAYITALFASPHYGERMAVDWLDAARFADTQGYQVDRDQDMHPFRDWVIGAFNRNMRFDQFTIEQIAGDLLPGATLEQKIATGFQRSHRINTEGGVIPAEFVAEYTADRVETTGSVWLGQTFNCTRCHDHKFDPFTQRDFYSMKAFYNNVGEQGDGALDTVTLSSPELEKKIAPLQKEVVALQEKLAKQNVTDTDVRTWAERLVKQRLAWEPFEIAKISAPQGKPKAASDGRAFDLGIVKKEAKPVVASVKVPAGKTITALRIECATESDAASVGLGRVALQDAKKGVIELSGAAEGDSHKAVESARIVEAVRAVEAGGKGKRKAKGNEVPSTALAPGPNQPAEALVWQITKPFIAKGAGETFDISIVVSASNRETEWRILFTEGQVDQLVAESTIDIAKKDPATLTAAEKKTLKQEFLLALPEAKSARTEIADITARMNQLRNQQPTAIVMLERDKPKDTFILMRGEYNQPGEKVTAATPGVLPPLAAGAPANRLGLARWLVSPENPLTARVTVNRLWQSVFGTGLVRTSEDFGAQGEAPSHPELLDWLAAEFQPLFQVELAPTGSSFLTVIRSGWPVNCLRWISPRQLGIRFMVIRCWWPGLCDRATSHKITLTVNLSSLTVDLSSLTVNLS